MLGNFILKQYKRFKLLGNFILKQNNFPKGKNKGHYFILKKEEEIIIFLSLVDIGFELAVPGTLVI